MASIGMAVVFQTGKSLLKWHQQADINWCFILNIATRLNSCNSIITIEDYKEKNYWCNQHWCKKTVLTRRRKQQGEENAPTNPVLVGFAPKIVYFVIVKGFAAFSHGDVETIAHFFEVIVGDAV
eukprot:14854941-Ditylum_brightwellii.AAC.1